jgi:hypothetical protein
MTFSEHSGRYADIANEWGGCGMKKPVRNTIGAVLALLTLSFHQGAAAETKDGATGFARTPLLYLALRL